MKLLLLIDRIKAACPSFANRVSGAAEYAAAVPAADRMPVPHAFVVRLAEHVQGSITAGAVTQPSEEWFGVLVCVSATADQQGYAGDVLLDDLRDELKAALKGWQPDEEHAPLEYRGFETLDINRARLWRAFLFSSLTGD